MCIFLFQFIGLVSVEENNVKPNQSLSNLTIDYSAALFIEVASWSWVAVGCCYVAFGICCGQRYLHNVNEDYSNRLKERKRIFEVGLESDAALSRQMVD